MSDYDDDDVLEDDVEEDDFDRLTENNEDEPEGENLMDTMLEDYQEIAELDQYEQEGIDDTEYDHDGGAKARADKEMEKRDRAEMRRRLARSKAGERRGMILPSSDEEDEDEDSDSASADVGFSRRRAKRRRMGGDPGDGDDDGDDDDLPAEDLNAEKLQKSTEVHENSRLGLMIMRAFEHFLRTYRPDDWKGDNPYYVDSMQRMAEETSQTLTIRYIPDLMHAHPVLAQWIAEAPEKIIPLLTQVAQDMAETKFETYRGDHHMKREIFVRFMGFPVVDDIRELRCSHISTFVHVIGVVTRRSQVYPELKTYYYNCMKCSHTNGPFAAPAGSDMEMPIPKACVECESKGPFVICKEKTLYQNYQRVMLQESPGNIPPGRMPRSKEVILQSDLVDTVRPGDEVEVYGTYKAKYECGINVHHSFPVFHTRLEANNIVRRNDVKLQQITDEDHKEIIALSNDEEIRERIIASMAPSIYGEPHLKTALACAMFGAVPKVVAGKHRIRGDLNVLIMGDPGLAKSQCLKYVNKTFERSVFTTGKGASGVGLTAAVMKDRETGEWVLEGGALVLADSGICLIDEFDKMNDQDRTSIHEAMEQQSISISKAGIITTLSARCAVIAAANPIGGRYDSQLTFSENVELTDPILSRFDIICVLKDEVDAGKDEQLAEFVVVSHMRSHPTDPDTKIKSRFEQARENAGKKQIPQELLKKYILYARSQIMPKVSDVDNAKISKFYSEIRRESFQTGGVPMTVRHLESIVRIAEANARMELREFVSTRDVDHAIATMLECFIQTQKHQVAEKLRSRFSRYLGASADQSTLCKHLLEKELRRVSQLAQLAFDYDAASSPTVKQNIFLSVAERHQVRDAAVNFLRSEAFTGPAPEYEFVERPEDETQAAQAPGDRLIRRIQT
jgi:DNA replication licensing factor MCM2